MSTLPALRPICRPMTRSIFDAGKKSAERIISDLFSAGQQGFWLPFTDFASLSQDAAGTLPYTALEQPVGRVLDRSGRGNHATQPTSTARGVVSARVNLLTKTEQFVELGKYNATNITVTENAGTAPDGTGTAIKLAATASAISTVFYEAVFGQTALQHIWYIKKGTLSGNFGNTLLFRNTTTSTNLAIARIDFDTGVITNTLGAAFSSASAGDGWWKITGTLTSGFAATDVVRLYYGWGSSAATAGDFILVWHPDCRNPNLFNNATPDYQRVNTPTDYDSIGFPKSLSVQVDDFYTCGGGGSTTGFFFSDVLSVVSGSNGMLFDVVDAANAAYRTYVLFNAYNQLIVSFTSGSGTFAYTTTAALTGGAMSSVQLWYDGSLLSIQMGSGTIETFAAVGPNQTGSVIHLYRHKFAAVNYFNGKVTEPIFRVGPPPNAHEREVIRTYQMQKAGL